MYCLLKSGSGNELAAGLWGAEKLRLLLAMSGFAKSCCSVCTPFEAWEPGRRLLLEGSRRIRMLEFCRMLSRDPAPLSIGLAWEAELTRRRPPWLK